MTPDVEGVADGGVQGVEPSGGAGRPEPLHLPFSSPRRPVRDLGPVVLAQARLVPRRKVHFDESGAAGPQPMHRDHGGAPVP